MAELVEPGTVSKDNPRTLRHVKTGAETRAMNPLEYTSMSMAQGYADVTDETAPQPVAAPRQRPAQPAPSTAPPQPQQQPPAS